ncbi:hypothetical protein A0257_20780 [Hymenobacter psoromatis]|nr:hypothetical protein A0257_20780 [Hymenobacter psoromatis]
MLIYFLSRRVASAQDSTLTRLIHQNQYALTPQGSQFSGPGWDKLRASIQKSQFVLLGEDHGTAQIPQFAAAVAREFRPAVFVAEVDPYVAQTLTQLAAQPGLPTAYARQYPQALCFYDWREEFELIRSLRAQQVRLVGLDQVFLANAAPTYARLASEVKSKTAKAYFQRRATAFQARDQANERLGKKDYILASQPAAALDSLRTLTQGESPAVRQLVQDYAASYAIYQSQFKGTGGHQERLNLMRRHLLQEFQRYQPATTQPVSKMLFKFGDAHLARGLSPITGDDFYDVGNLAQDLAQAQDQTSLHLYVAGRQGSAAISLNPTFPDKIARTYAATDKPKLQLFFAQMSSPAWSVFDLRPARRALTAGTLHLASPGLQRIIQGYDYLVVIPETTASHPM